MTKERLTRITIDDAQCGDQRHDPEIGVLPVNLLQ